MQRSPLINDARVRLFDILLIIEYQRTNHKGRKFLTRRSEEKQQQKGEDGREGLVRVAEQHETTLRQKKMLIIEELEVDRTCCLDSKYLLFSHIILHLDVVP